VQNSTRLPASALKEGGRYAFTGKLTIDGNLPPNVTLFVNEGKLVVNGNVGAGDVLNVSLPTVTVGATTSGGGTHQEKYGCNTWAYGPSQDKPGQTGYHYGYFPNGCTKDVPNATTTSGGHEELKYKDSDPAVKITGTKAADAEINTTGRTAVLNGAAAKPATGQAPQPRS
jgi:hypothetical protein